MSRARLNRKFSSSALLCALAVPALLLAGTANAQEQIDGEVSMQRFDPAPGPGNFLTTRGVSQVRGHMGWTAGLLANYAFEPFTVKRCEADCGEDDVITKLKVVENMVSGDLMGSLSLIDMIQVGLKVPVTWAKGQGIEETEDGVGAPSDGLSAVGLGDIQLEGKARLYEMPNELAVFGAYLYATAPTGTIMSEGSYIGNESPTVGGAGVVDGKLGALKYGVNLGGVWRAEAKIGGQTTVGPEARWNAAVGYEVSPILTVVADAFGGTDFNTKDLGASSAEVDLGAKIVPLGNQLTFTVGGGIGALKGVGVPTARGFLGVTYNAATQDRDRDGIADDVDACADAAEDMDGYEDGDGCPELDNDQDGLPDTADKCPSKPEDVDGFEDKDGCPELDNDKDGIEDAQDHCPLQPENKNGIDDIDGCPEIADEDQDGVEDSKDKCPTKPEDTDGFEDTDGCPDPDNDKDGIPDNGDECIDEPEDGKGSDAEKKDGCPIDA